MSKEEPREEHQELLQVVSTLKSRVETLEHEKREMGEILERQRAQQKRTDDQKERVIEHLMKKVNQLIKDKMENCMEKEESKSPVWEESRTDSGSSTHESGGTVLEATRMDSVSNDTEIESISNPSFWSAGSGERNGPDQILETSAVKTTNRGDAVKLPMEEHGVASRQPVSVPTLFRQKVEECQDLIALHYKEDGEWIGITYRQYYHQVNSAAKAFIKLGLKRLHAVCMFGYNNPRWFMGHLAAIFAGGIAAGIYHTNEIDACEYIARDAKAHIFVVEGQREVSIMKEVQERLKQKLVIIQYSGLPDDEDVYTWQDVLDIGEKESDEELKERLAQIAINQCCALVYTSGTSGLSKGVMLNHDNLTWESLAYTDYLGIKPMRVLSYLSLAHIAALIVDLYGSMVHGGEVYFADRTITQGMNLALTLQEVQPTFFFTVPRGWEKMCETIQREIASAPWIKKQIVGLALLESYGLSESCGPHTCGILKDFLIGASGAVREGFHAKIADPDDEGNGEILLNGRNIAMGYLNKEEETKEAIDDEGWLHTGDIVSQYFSEMTGSFCRCFFPWQQRLTLVNGLPLPNLAPDTIAWCRNIGSAANTIHDILEGPDERVMQAIQQAIDEVNAAAYNNQHRIQKWAILPLDFSINGEELTPTAKVRMNIVTEKYKHIIDDMYDV
ncbi:long-chain-fatty-acid--CoA ligase ACSBG2-like [Macrobrachium rosenbergii]|uniref:long-chain-fatty-acid--CoA ligase ACSBG2-like n=1 Tax=Macrobrachium rosenbergii TaxID=79674 RepID=UPI0034D664CA